MTKQHLSGLPLLLILSAVGACEAPKDDVPPPSDDGPADGGADEVGELPSGDPDDPPLPLPTGYCVTAEQPPYEGIRHHCGGTLALSFTGEALGNKVDEQLGFNFGPSVPGDSYESPLVAACCAEYDFEQLASSQPNHWENCLYDAIQQTCASLPYYVWDMAQTAKAQGKHVVADKLTKLGNDLAGGDMQFDCIESLLGEEPAESFNVITDTHWNPAYDVWLNVDSLEILEVALPEDPADWLTCKSTYENEETVVPDLGSGPVWNVLDFDSGSLKLSGFDIELSVSPDVSSELLLSAASDGTPLLGSLRLRGGPLVLEEIEIDRWQLSSLRLRPTLARADGSFSISEETLSFVAAVVVGGETINVHATNASALVLRETKHGWAVEPFSVVYTQDTGDVWTLNTSTLDFRRR